MFDITSQFYAQQAMKAIRDWLVYDDRDLTPEGAEILAKVHSLIYELNKPLFINKDTDE